jgi:hypothetical protein
VLETTEGTFFDGGFVGVFGRSDERLKVGDAFTIRRAEVRVLGVRDGYPTSIEVHFEASLDAPDLELLSWSEGRLRKIDLPLEGAPLELPWSPGPTGLF